jgi:TonB family protein
LGIMAALTPFRERPDGNRLTPQASPKDNAGLDCIGTEPELQGMSEATSLPLTTYCMEKGNHLLRLISRPNSVEIAFNNLVPFGRGYMPRTVQVALKGRESLHLHIDKLEPATDFSALESAPPADAQLLPFHRAEQPWRTGEFMHAQLLTKVSPRYPQTGMNGTVVVKVHIDKSGAVSTAEILSADNQILKAPILTAVKQWKYRPAYQAGELKEDEQTIHFAYGKEDAE